ncbi:uncharacterized protein LOC120781610 [Bactrocera tryoni]|uniref:uncharacterized protein LOC120781610 n=1 Tax=Bactrocera tryoni TaxID=59916 RepID=UPI001A97B8B1|nr:uncharacterized protein LOC120781610 [Bactrocera tryoni]
MERCQLIKLFCIEMQKLCLLIWWKRLQNRKGRGGSCGVRKMLLKRPKEGHFTLLIPKIRLNDVETFINFHRMDPNSFDELLHILGPSMRNTPNKSEEEITQAERLALTLRYLASGDSMKSIGFYGIRIGASTTSNIIRETCELIWKKLQFVFPAPSEEVWANVADDFFFEVGVSQLPRSNRRETCCCTGVSEPQFADIQL